MKLKWDDLRLFLTVVEQGSLSAAARMLKLGQPTLSRRIGELEALIGEPLFVRVSQGVTLTATGQKLLPSAQRMAEWASEAGQSVTKQGPRPAGRVRIAAPPGFAYELIVPLAVEIRQQYPDIQIDVLSGIEMLNLGRGEADLALRNKAPTDADLICVDSVSGPIRIYTSKEYAKSLPRQFTIADLDWISWAAPYDHLRAVQELKKNIPNFDPVFTSDDYIVQLAACKAGLGAMLLPKAGHRFSQLDRLEELDIDLGPDAIGTLYLVCHKRQRYLPKAQLVIDAISREFEQMRLGSM